MTRVIVFGATSYVGESVIAALKARNVDVVALTRRPAIARDMYPHVFAETRVMTPSEFLAEPAPEAQAVINLAYIKEAPPHLVSAANATLVDGVLEVASHVRAERVIQVSTIAVFGNVFTASPEPGPAPRLTGDLYLESKAAAERRFAERLPEAGRLAVVRLGNVFGPGDPVWAGRISQRLLEGRPIGYTGRLGFANATYVGNAADYLVHVATESSATADRYHHCTEFAERSWSSIVNVLGKAIGVEPRYVEAPGRVASGSIQADTALLLRRLYKGPVGTGARSLLKPLRDIPAVQSTVDRLRAERKVESHLAAPRVPPEDAGFYEVLCAPVRIDPHLAAGWRPPTDFDAALRRTSDWVRQAGYSLRD